MKIYLGIPTYNRKDLLDRLLDSLKPSEKLLDKIIIVDNGHQNLATSQNTKLIENDNNLGYAGAVNQILNIGKNEDADWVLILNDDITVYPWFMEKTLPILELCNQKWLLTPDWEWACIAFSKLGIENLEFIPGQWLDEKFWPGYYSDNDLHRRISCSGKEDDIMVAGVPELTPWIRDKSKTKERAPELNHFCGQVYYELKWKGGVGEEAVISFNPEVTQNDYKAYIFNHYKSLCNNISDINEHLPTLLEYAKNCEHITELGTRWVVSSYAFLAGNPKTFITYDLVKDPKVDIAAFLANGANICFKFKQENTRECDLEETDLLFIDTWHTYNQLKVELHKHHTKVKKYIIMHDTISYRFTNEGRYADHTNLIETNKGLWPAITEFLNEYKDVWILEKEYENNNGLTVLKRIKNAN